MRQNSKHQNVTIFENLKCDKTQKLKMWQNLRTHNCTKLKNSKHDKNLRSKCDKTR